MTRFKKTYALKKCTSYVRCCKHDISECLIIIVDSGNVFPHTGTKPLPESMIARFMPSFLIESFNDMHFKRPGAYHWSIGVKFTFGKPFLEQYLQEEMKY